jgi:hypothetical protein
MIYLSRVYIRTSAVDIRIIGQECLEGNASSIINVETGVSGFNDMDGLAIGSFVSQAEDLQ